MNNQSTTSLPHVRSIVWLQTKREQAGGAVPRPRGREDGSEFRLGRLKHERVVVPRGDALLDWARQLMRLHATRKAVLEVWRDYSLMCYLNNYRNS